MEYRKVIIRLKDGSIVHADISRCSCGNEVFHVIFVQGEHHSHLQCAAQVCGKVYCHGEGECAGKHTAEITVWQTL